MRAVSASAFVTGFALAASVLVAIGPQNAFVLRQGLRREHVLAVVSACSLFDLVLMAAGIAGLGAMVRSRPALGAWLGAGGVAFLLAYGALALRRAMRPQRLRAADDGRALRPREALLQSAAFTFLNPHVYLDTVLLIGSVGAQQPAGSAPSYLAGSASAAALWFFGLGFGARLLAPAFAHALAWRALDALIALTMFALAFALGSSVLRASGLAP